MRFGPTCEGTEDCVEGKGKAGEETINLGGLRVSAVKHENFT